MEEVVNEPLGLERVIGPESTPAGVVTMSVVSELGGWIAPDFPLKLTLVTEDKWAPLKVTVANSPAFEGLKLLT